MNKRGFELPLNMIVIVIIAIITLFIALGFVTGFLQKVLNPDLWPVPETNCDMNDKITFAPIELTRGQDNRMTICFYNNEDADITNTVIPTIACNEIGSVNVKSAGISVPVGDRGKYKALVQVPSNTPPGQYSCSITISQTESSFFMSVK